MSETTTNPIPKAQETTTDRAVLQERIAELERELQLAKAESEQYRRAAMKMMASQMTEEEAEAIARECVSSSDMVPFDEQAIADLEKLVNEGA